MDVVALSKIRKLQAQILAIGNYVHPTGDGYKHVPAVVTEEPVTLDPAKIGSIITLSDGNLTASGLVAGWALALATISRNAGKYYFEFVAGTPVNGVACGLALATAGFNSWLGDGAAVGGNADKTWGYSSVGGYINTGGKVEFESFDGFAQGDVIGVAVDIDAGIFTFNKNNVYMRRWVNREALDYFPAVSCNGDGGSGTSSGTIKLAAASFTYTPPEGFVAWGIETASGKSLIAGNESGEFNWQSLGYATEAVAGIAELATEAEVLAGIETDKIITPATLQTKIAALPAGGGGVTDDDVLEIIFLGGNG